MKFLRWPIIVTNELCKSNVSKSLAHVGACVRLPVAVAAPLRRAKNLCELLY